MKTAAPTSPAPVSVSVHRSCLFILAALLSLLTGGCATMHAMIDAGLTFGDNARAGNIKGLGPDSTMQIRDYEVATSRGGVKCAIVRVEAKKDGPETKYILVQMPKEKTWTIMSTGQVLERLKK